ncbi:MAG: hypothetical protein DMF91_05920 [Acidobacteria bacterium]|nr:MAG: hypothetical protein DMF91_05920 [Acidobacteriota bacterium]
MRRAVRSLATVDLVVVTSANAAMAELVKAVPQLILLSALLKPSDEAYLAAHLRSREDAAHVEMLTIPLLDGPPRREEKKRGLLGVFKRGKSRDDNHGRVSPRVFANEIKAHLERIREAQAAAEPVSKPEPIAAAPKIAAESAPADPIVSVTLRRVMLVSDPVPGVRLSELLARASERAAVADLPATLFVMRRLLSAVASLHVATDLARAPVALERVVITPRAEVLVVTSVPSHYVAGASEADRRIDIAGIAVIAMSMMLGRRLDGSEHVPKRSELLAEVGDVGAIRAGDAFSTLLRSWFDRALATDVSASFPDFSDAALALEQVERAGCAASRRALKAFLKSLALENFDTPEATAIEATRLRAIRANLGAKRRTSVESAVYTAATTFEAEPAAETVTWSMPAPEPVVEMAPEPPYHPAETLADAIESVAPSYLDPGAAIEEAAQAQHVSESPSEPYSSIFVQPPVAPVAEAPSIWRVPEPDFSSDAKSDLYADPAPEPSVFVQPPETPLAEPISIWREPEPEPTVETAMDTAPAPPAEDVAIDLTADFFATPPEPDVVAVPVAFVPEPPPAVAPDVPAPPVAAPPEVPDDAGAQRARHKAGLFDLFRSFRARHAAVESPEEPIRPQEILGLHIPTPEIVAEPIAPAAAEPVAPVEIDAVVASEPPAVFAEPPSVYTEPPAAYVEPAAVYEEPPVVFAEPPAVVAESIAPAMPDVQEAEPEQLEPDLAAAPPSPDIPAAEHAAPSPDEDVVQEMLRTAISVSRATLGLEPQADVPPPVVEPVVEPEPPAAVPEPMHRPIVDAPAAPASRGASLLSLFRSFRGRRTDTDVHQEPPHEPVALPQPEPVPEIAASAPDFVAREAFEPVHDNVAPPAISWMPEPAADIAPVMAESSAEPWSEPVQSQYVADQPTPEIAAAAEEAAPAPTLEPDTHVDHVDDDWEQEATEPIPAQPVATNVAPPPPRTWTEDIAPHAAEPDSSSEAIWEDIERQADATQAKVEAAAAADVPSPLELETAPAADTAPPVYLETLAADAPAPVYLETAPAADEAPPLDVETPPAPVAPSPFAAPVAIMPPPIVERPKPAVPNVKGPTTRGASVAGRARRWTQAAAAIVVGAVLVSGVRAFYLRATTPGTLRLESTPKGSQVLVDGTERGTTPLTLQLPAGKHVVELHRNGATRQFTLDIGEGEDIDRRVDWSGVKPVGSLAIASQPPGARVIIDGKFRGVTPMTISDLAIGSHAVVLDGKEGSVRRTVMIKAGSEETLDESIFSGWIAVFAPFELKITEGKHFIGTTESGKLIMPAGRHELLLANAALGYRETRVLDVNPGQTTSLTIEAAEGIVRINAPAGTEVSIDGQRVGITPLGDLHVAIGSREIVCKHPQLGQQRVVTDVTRSAPVELNIDFGKR